MGSRKQNFYNQLAQRMGYEKEAAEIQDKYLAGDKDGAAAAVPQRTDRLHLPARLRSSGSPTACGRTRTPGVTTLTLAPAGFTLDERVAGAARRRRGAGARRAGVGREAPTVRRRAASWTAPRRPRACGQAAQARTSRPSSRPKSISRAIWPGPPSSSDLLNRNASGRNLAEATGSGESGSACTALSSCGIAVASTR